MQILISISNNYSQTPLLFSFRKLQLDLNIQSISITITTMAELHDDLDFGVSLDTDDATNQQKKQTVGAQFKRQISPRSNGSHERSNGSHDMIDNSVGKNDYNLSQAAHPTVCIATFAFKMAAFLMYFPIGYVLSTILMFIIVLVLSAVDFWVVKNVTGRILVGLRWRSEYDQNGKQVWKFQSYDKQFTSNKVDKAFFWGSQVLGTVVWGFFLVINILGLNFFNGTLLFICTSMCFTNFYGFYKCRGDHHKKLKDLKSKYGAKGLMKLAGNFM